MKEVVIEAEPRELSTKHTLKTHRIDGKLPGVFYGADEKPVTISIDMKKFEQIVHGGMGGNVLVNLKIGGTSKNALIKEVQRHIITQKPIHVDFQGISMTKKFEVVVPLKIVGEAPGVKLSGGILEQITRELHVRCLPKDIPEQIHVDVSNLQINHSISVKDIIVPEGIEVLNDKHNIVVNVVIPTELEEVAPASAAAAAGAAEPEVISKGKKVEGEEGESKTAKAAETAKSTEPKK